MSNRAISIYTRAYNNYYDYHYHAAKAILYQNNISLHQMPVNPLMDGWLGSVKTRAEHTADVL